MPLWHGTESNKQNNEKGIFLSLMLLCHIEREAKNFKAVLLKMAFMICLQHNMLGNLFRGAGNFCKAFRTIFIRVLVWLDDFANAFCYKQIKSKDSFFTPRNAKSLFLNKLFIFLQGRRNNYWYAPFCPVLEVLLSGGTYYV